MGSLLYHGKDPSGQMYRRNRFYDPQSGRFTQEDPIGIAGGLNVYGYAGGDPVTYRDPFGLDKIYQNLYGREVHRVEQEGPDEYYLRHEGKSYRLERPLVQGSTPYEIHLTGADETAMRLANRAPRHGRVIAGLRSMPGNRLDFKTQAPLNNPRSLWLLANGIMARPDKVGNIAWGYYVRTVLEMPWSEALTWASLQGFAAGGEDPLDQWAVWHAYSLPVPRR